MNRVQRIRNGGLAALVGAGVALLGASFSGIAGIDGELKATAADRAARYLPVVDDGEVRLVPRPAVRDCPKPDRRDDPAV